MTILFPFSVPFLLTGQLGASAPRVADGSPPLRLRFLGLGRLGPWRGWVGGLGSLGPRRGLGRLGAPSRRGWVGGLASLGPRRGFGRLGSWRGWVGGLRYLGLGHGFGRLGSHCRRGSTCRSRLAGLSHVRPAGHGPARAGPDWG